MYLDRILIAIVYPASITYQRAFRVRIAAINIAALKKSSLKYFSF
jgi:hypothetical protein